jgi:hypothetical protein
VNVRIRDGSWFKWFLSFIFINVRSLRVPSSMGVRLSQVEDLCSKRTNQICENCTDSEAPELKSHIALVQTNWREMAFRDWNVKKGSRKCLRKGIVALKCPL